MADYQRFVAYVYEYQKEKKGSNCGFVKVEVKGTACRIELHLQCQGLLPDSECKVYGFVRNKGLLDGILLGSCITAEGSAQCMLETSAEQMGGSEKTLNEMGGMVFTTDQGGFWGTEWDDQKIRPGDFRALDHLLRTEAKETVENDTDSLENAEEKKTEEAGNDEMPEQKAAEEQELHTQSVQEQETETSESPQNTERSEQNIQNLPGTPCEAFFDGELEDCRKISPQELCRLGRRACMLRNNRFVQYGSYNFGHLLLCRNKKGQMALGVPGGYDQQERFMANMFGFPYFKESQNIQIPDRKGGYWYRLIDSANSNKRNGDL